MIRNEEEMLEKWEYMWNNPLKKGLSEFDSLYRVFKETLAAL